MSKAYMFGSETEGCDGQLLSALYINRAALNEEEFLKIAKGAPNTLESSSVTADLNAEDCQGDTLQILDRTENKSHAKLPPSGASRLPRKLDFEVRHTNTWDGTSEVQYIGGANDPILPNGYRLVLVEATVKGAGLSEISVGNGTVDDYHVPVTDYMQEGGIQFEINNTDDDGTNKKLTVHPHGNFTGSISWVIKGLIKEG